MSTKITLEDRLFTLEEVVFLMSEAVEQPEKNEYDIVDFFFLKNYKKQQEALMAKERAKNYMRLKDGYKEKPINFNEVELLVEKIYDSEVIQRIRVSKSDAEARRIIRTIYK